MITRLAVPWTLLALSAAAAGNPYPYVCDQRVFPDETVAVAITEGTLYTGGRNGSIRAFDLGVPDRPAEIDAFNLPGEIQSIKVRGDILFVSMAESGVFAVLSSTGDIVATFDSSPVYDVDLNLIGGLYAATGFAGLAEIPWDGSAFGAARPVPDATDTIWRVRAQGSWLGLPMGVSGAAGLDTVRGRTVRRDPGRYVEDAIVVDDGLVVSCDAGIVLYPLWDSSRSLWVSNEAGRCLLARTGPLLLSAGKSLLIHEMSPGGSARKAGEVYLPSSAYDLAVRDSYVYMACGRQGLITVDLERIDSPKELRKDYLGGEYLKAARAGDLAVAVLKSGLVDLLDLSTGASPTRYLRYSDHRPVSDVALSDRSAVFASPNFGIYAVDLSDPENPAPLWELSRLRENASLVVQDGTHVFASTISNGLRIMEKTPMSPPKSVAFSPGVSVPHGLHKHGDRLLLSEHRRGFSVWDVAHPTAPGLLSSTHEVRAAGRFVSWNDRLLLADAMGGVKGYELVPEGTPYLRFVIPTHDATDIVLDGTMAWVADGHGGILALGLEDPEPEVWGRYLFEGNISALLVNSPYLYAFSRGGYLTVCDTTPGPVTALQDQDRDGIRDVEDLFPTIAGSEPDWLIVNAALGPLEFPSGRAFIEFSAPPQAGALAVWSTPANLSSASGALFADPPEALVGVLDRTWEVRESLVASAIATLTLRFTPEELAASGLKEEELVVLSVPLPAGPLQPLPTEIDPVQHTAAARITTFHEYRILAIGGLRAVGAARIESY